MVYMMITPFDDGPPRWWAGSYPEQPELVRRMSLTDCQAVPIDPYMLWIFKHASLLLNGILLYVALLCTRLGWT